MRVQLFNKQALRILSGVLACSILAGCSQSSGINTTTGSALGGTALGAGLGAIVGEATGNTGAGIAIGAAAGAVGGALIGNQLQNGEERIQAQQEAANRTDAQISENQRVIDELRRRGADVRNTKRGVVVNLPDILFEFDSAHLTSDARRTVGEIGEVVGSVKGRTVSVEGHTDSVGTFSYNERLSRDRAQNVARELDQSGVPPEMLRVRGLGEGAPIATNNSEAGRARNRRVEVIIEN